MWAASIAWDHFCVFCVCVGGAAHLVAPDARRTSGPLQSRQSAQRVNAFSWTITKKAIYMNLLCTRSAAAAEENSLQCARSLLSRTVRPARFTRSAFTGKGEQTGGVYVHFFFFKNPWDRITPAGSVHVARVLWLRGNINYNDNKRGEGFRSAERSRGAQEPFPETRPRVSRSGSGAEVERSRLVGADRSAALISGGAAPSTQRRAMERRAETGAATWVRAMPIITRKGVTVEFLVSKWVLTPKRRN